MSQTAQSEKRGRIKTLPCLLFGLLFALVLPLGSWSQQSSSPSASLGALEIRATPEFETTLRIQNRDIVKLRATVGGFSPEQRARNIVDRFGQVVGRKTTAPLISRREFPQGIAFYVDDQFIFAIAPQDLDTPSGETLEQAADRAEGQLHVAIKESFEARNIRGLLGSLLLASLATAAFFAFVFAVQRIRVRTCRALERRESTAHFLTRLFGTTFRIALNVAVLVIELVAANLWITFVLQKFPYTRPWGETISKKILAVLFKISIAITNALPDVLIVAMIFLACYVITRLANKLFFAIKSGDVVITGFHPEVVPPTRRLLTAAIWIFGFVMAYPYIPGSQSDAFKGVSVLLGLLVTLGSSGVFGQSMCGILLMYARAFRPGDYVRIGETEGVVVELGTLSTKIRTPKNELVSIPNSVVVTQESKNFSRLQDAGGVILHTSVTIGYNSPWRQVEEMLILAAEKTPGLKREPTPFVLQAALGDYAVEYQLNAYLQHPEERIPTLALLHRNIQDEFNQHGVQIMTPHYRKDPPEPQVVPTERWYEAPARRDKPVDVPSFFRSAAGK